MIPEAQDLQAVIQRLEKLERQNRKPKRVAVAVLLLVGCVLLIG